MTCAIVIVPDDDSTIAMECKCGWSKNMGRELTIPELFSEQTKHYEGMHLHTCTIVTTSDMKTCRWECLCGAVGRWYKTKAAVLLADDYNTTHIARLVNA